MPLNPNGKIDKPALPFPDTAQLVSVGPSGTGRAANPTEEKMRSIWSNILPNPPSPIPLDESFFDLGGHSILATRLVFEIRKAFVVNAPLGLIFDQPTVAGLVKAVDALRNADLGLAYKDTTPPSSTGLLAVPGAPATQKESASVAYGDDYVKLLSQLREAYPPLSSSFAKEPVTVFLTGATGFLGAFVLRELLLRQDRVKKVMCHVRGATVEKGLARLKEGSTDREAWDDAWVSSGRLEVVIGDLGQELLGLSTEAWDRVAEEADVVLHNGALVCFLL